MQCTGFMISVFTLSGWSPVSFSLKMCPKFGRSLCGAEVYMVVMSGMFRRLLGLLKRAAPSLRSLLLCRSHSYGHLEMLFAVFLQKTELSPSDPRHASCLWGFPRTTMVLKRVKGDEKQALRRYLYFLFLLCLFFFSWLLFCPPKYMR